MGFANGLRGWTRQWRNTMRDWFEALIRCRRRLHRQVRLEVEAADWAFSDGGGEPCRNRTGTDHHLGPLHASFTPELSRHLFPSDRARNDHAFAGSFPWWWAHVVGAPRVHPHEHCADYPPKSGRRGAGGSVSRCSGHQGVRIARLLPEALSLGIERSDLWQSRSSIEQMTRKVQCVAAAASTRTLSATKWRSPTFRYQMVTRTPGLTAAGLS
jgi:hypothetical protein